MALEELTLQFISDNNLVEKQLTYSTPDGKVGHIMFYSDGRVVISKPTQAQPQPPPAKALLPPAKALLPPVNVQSGGAGASVLPKCNFVVETGTSITRLIAASLQNVVHRNTVPSQQFARPPSPQQARQSVSVTAHPITQPDAPTQVNADGSQRPKFSIQHSAGKNWDIYDGTRKLAPTDFKKVGDQDESALTQICSKKASTITLYYKKDTSEYYMKYGTDWFKYNNA
jgi:hypothetical protein